MNDIQKMIKYLEKEIAKLEPEDYEEDIHVERHLKRALSVAMEIEAGFR